MAPALPTTGQALAPSPEETSEAKERKTAWGPKSRAIPPLFLTIRLELPANRSTDGQQTAAQQQQTARLGRCRRRTSPHGNVVEGYPIRIIPEIELDGVGPCAHHVKRELGPIGAGIGVGQAEQLGTIPISAEIARIIPN